MIFLLTRQHLSLLTNSINIRQGLPYQHLIQITRSKLAIIILKHKLNCTSIVRHFTDFGSVRAKSTPLTEIYKENEKVMTPPTTNLVDKIRVDFSPCSDGYNTGFTDDDQAIDTIKHFESEKELSEEIVVSETVEKDGDSYDEGVEDISSDYDHLNSPQSNTGTSQVKLRPTPEINNRINRLSSVRERIPSRFSFGN